MFQFTVNILQRETTPEFFDKQTLNINISRDLNVTQLQLQPPQQLLQLQQQPLQQQLLQLH